MARKKTTATANETAEKAAETKEEVKAVKETASSAKKEVKKKIYIEYGNGQINIDDIYRDVLAAYSAENKAVPETVEIYIKPEERAAYYVVNGVPEGKKTELHF